jgi:hypothetical protein
MRALSQGVLARRSWRRTFILSSTPRDELGRPLLVSINKTILCIIKKLRNSLKNINNNKKTEKYTGL